MTLVSTAAKTAGSSTGGLVSLFDSTLGANGPSIDTGANGIAAGYATLIVHIVARTADAGVFGGLAVRFNADAGANYDWQQLYGSNVAAAAAATLGATSYQPYVHGSGGTADYSGLVVLTIPAYTATTFRKVGVASLGRPDTTAANNSSEAHVFGWRNTAAISRMSVAGLAANLLAGSRLTIYGTP